MKERVRDLIHTQNGYSKVDLEDGLPSPWMSVVKNGLYTGVAEFVWSSISILMFLSGALMLLVAQHRRPSDAECTAQLSIWCEMNIFFNLDILHMKDNADMMSPSATS